MSTRLSAHFTSSEFACHCGCGADGVSFHLVQLLESIRSRAGDKPITIVSGVRCEKRNRAVGGAIKSYHLYGKAADIKIKGMTPSQVRSVINDIHKKDLAHVGGLKTYNTFVHVDIRDKLWRGN